MYIINTERIAVSLCSDWALDKLHWYTFTMIHVEAEYDAVLNDLFIELGLLGVNLHIYLYSKKI